MSGRVAVAVLVGVYGVLALVLALSESGPVQAFAHVDYIDYHYASVAIRSGVSPYDAGWADARAAADSVPWIAGSDYLYAPWFAVGLLPLAWLPVRLAATVFMVASAAATLAALWLLARPLRRPGVWLMVGGLLPPVLFTLFVGQVNAWLLLGLTVAWVLRDRAPAWAGTVLGLCAAVKLSPLVLVGWAFWRRRYRMACTALGGVAVLLVVGELATPGSTAVWWTEVLPTTRAHLAHHAHPANQSVYALCLRLFEPNSWTTPLLVVPKWVDAVVVGVLVVLALGVAAASGRPGRARTEAERGEWSAIVVWMLLAAPLSWESTWMLGLLPLALLAHAGHRWTLLVPTLLIQGQRAFDGFGNHPTDWPMLQAMPWTSSLTVFAGVWLLGLSVRTRTAVDRPFKWQRTDAQTVDLDGARTATASTTSSAETEAPPAATSAS